MTPEEPTTTKFNGSLAAIWRIDKIKQYMLSAKTTKDFELHLTYLNALRDELAQLIEEKEIETYFLDDDNLKTLIKLYSQSSASVDVNTINTKLRAYEYKLVRKEFTSGLGISKNKDSRWAMGDSD